MCRVNILFQRLTIFPDEYLGHPRYFPQSHTSDRQINDKICSCLVSYNAWEIVCNHNITIRLFKSCNSSDYSTQKGVSYMYTNKQVSGQFKWMFQNA